jgi:hypothetical protein
LGVYFGGRAIIVRNSWLEKADKLRDENAERAEQIAQKEDKLNDVRNQRSLLERSWGRFWNSDNVRVTDPQQGIIATGIGTRQGLLISGQEGLPTVYGFYLPDNGPGRYIGEFKVVDVRDDSSSMQLTKLPRPDDIATWQEGRWRFWRSIPTQYSNRHDHLWNILVATEEHHNHVEDLKREATAQYERTNEQIEERVSELEGGPEIPMGISSLVKSLAQAEQERDEQLLAVDRLRKQIFGAQEKVQELIEESRRLMQQLPKPYLDTAGKPDSSKN